MDRAASAGPSIPEKQRVHNFMEYPFAWFGVLSESPFNAPELIYCELRAWIRVDQSAQREHPADVLPMPDPTRTSSSGRTEQIWDELQARIDGDDGFELKQGPIFERPSAVSQLRRRADALGAAGSGR